jgi:hypothetical protein
MTDMDLPDLGAHSQLGKCSLRFFLKDNFRIFCEMFFRSRRKLSEADKIAYEIARSSFVLCNFCPVIPAKFLRVSYFLKSACFGNLIVLQI